MFEWNERYSVQIGSIDAQHQNLFRIAYELYTAMSAGQGKQVMSRILNRLVQYTESHFAYEERLMRLNDYPDLPAHRAQHEALTKQVRQFQADYDAGRAAITVQVLQFLKDWLTNHIGSTDQQYVRLLKGKVA